MAFTYDVTTNRGKVRLRLADTVEDGHVFTDAEIDYFLDVGGTVAKAAIEGLQVLLVDAARREKSASVNGLSIDDRGHAAQIRESITALQRQSGATLNIRFPKKLPSDRSFDENAS